MKSGSHKKEKLITESWFSHIREEVDDGETLLGIMKAEQEIKSLRDEILDLQLKMQPMQKQISMKQAKIAELEQEIANDQYAASQSREE